MNLWQAIEIEARARKLEFLVIGGHAVNQYGYSRETADVDLLARATERKQWLQVFETLGYKLYSEKNTFLQLTAPPPFGWPVDLMFVSDDTWHKMSAEAREVKFADVLCRVPKLQHLIAMKVHSLRHGHAHRFLKDFQDVVGLIDVSGIDVASPEIREIFNAMEHPTSTKKSRERAREIELAVGSFQEQPPELEFPVAPGFVSKPPHIDPAAMLRRCEEMLRFRDLDREAKRRLAESVDVEFIM